MKKLFVFIVLVSGVLLFSNCHTSKKATASVPKITYQTNVQVLVAGNCAPCHFPPKGNKKALDSYTAVKDNIDDIIRRISLNPEDKGFMPFKHPKLSDSTVAVFRQWHDNGMPEN